MGCIRHLLGIFVHWIPMKMRVYQGSAFMSVRWTNRAKIVETDVQESGVAARNPLESGEGIMPVEANLP